MVLHTSTKWCITQEQAERHKSTDECESDEEAETGALHCSHAHFDSLQ